MKGIPLRIKIKYWWRLLRRRCSLCGGRKLHRTPLDKAPNERLCRACNKKLRFGALYGSGGAA